MVPFFLTQFITASVMHGLRVSGKLSSCRSSALKLQADAMFSSSSLSIWYSKDVRSCVEEKPVGIYQTHDTRDARIPTRHKHSCDTTQETHDTRAAWGTL